VLGKREHPKDMPRIMEAHDVGYIATASPSFPADLYDKIRKARDKKGTRYIHVSAPCPPGWVFPTRQTVAVGSLGVETGAVVLYEIEDGVFRLTDKSKALARRNGLKPLKDYLALQGRFKDLDQEAVEELQDRVTQRWEAYLRRG